MKNAKTHLARETLTRSGEKGKKSPSVAEHSRTKTGHPQNAQDSMEGFQAMRTLPHQAMASEGCNASQGRLLATYSVRYWDGLVLVLLL